MAQSYVTVDQIVNDFVLTMEFDDYANSVSDVTIRNLAKRAVREMGFDIMKRLKAVELTIDLVYQYRRTSLRLRRLSKNWYCWIRWTCIHISERTRTKTYSQSSNLTRFLIICWALTILFIATMCTPLRTDACMATEEVTTAVSTE